MLIDLLGGLLGAILLDAGVDLLMPGDIKDEMLWAMRVGFFLASMAATYIVRRVNA